MTHILISAQDQPFSKERVLDLIAKGWTQTSSGYFIKST